MKIGLVLDDSLDKSDGVQQYVLTLGHWYMQKGHEVHYLVGQTRRKDILHVHSLSRNLQVHFNQNRMSTPLPANKKKIKELLRKENFDVLHVQMPYSPFLAGRIVKAASSSTVIIGTFHVVPFSGLEKTATRILGLVLKRNLKRFDQIISVSVPAQRFAKKVFKIKSLVIPNVVSVAGLRKGKPVHKLKDGKVNIVFLGRLVERKGCMQLLKALQLMHEQQILGGVRVIICGKGPQESMLKQYVQKHRLGKCVRFVGFVTETEKANYLASADIAVFPSTGGESFGIVLIEAMAARAGVVLGGNNIGYSSVLKARSNQLFDPNNVNQFAKTLKYFAFNIPARKRASAWQEQQLSQYDVNKVGPVLIDLCDQIIAKKRKNADN